MPSVPAMSPAARRLDGATWLALVVTLVVYPALYCSGIMSGLVRPIITEHSRAHWWQFWWANMAFHWIPFGLVWVALRRGEGWGSLGVDWGWFWRRRWILGAVLVLLAAAAVFVPRAHYGDRPPGIARTLFLAPITTGERLWIIWVAVTAAVTEEVLFRGFALTRLTRVLGNPWPALAVTVVSFLFIHGTPRDGGALFAYTAAGLAFGVPFVLMGFKRLELLMLVHFLIDASMVFAP